MPFFHFKFNSPLRMNMLVLATFGNVIAGFVAFVLFDFIERLMTVTTLNPEPNYELIIALAALFGGVVAATITADFALATQVAIDTPEPTVPADFAEKLIGYKAE